ncbi:MAG: hypothetical protein JSS63_05065 [Bacteroidetes bacterium]|nr:hypothetical protein [Bacteroidota bacterium]MBX7045318.1 hypothetical protein [Ignavibacteria bacterium]
MESIQVKILNPKAKSILNDLADLKLISITDTQKARKDFLALVEKIRNQNKNKKKLSLKEITAEVKDERRKRALKS